MAKFQHGKYDIKNPKKYMSKHQPVYRSGWELKFMRVLDNHPNVIGWSSESQRIPYYNPITGKNTHYIPDFLIIYEDKNKNKKAELIEIKPEGQTLGNAKSVAEKKQAVINMVKWEAAQKYCKKMGIGFRVLTENELFNNPQKRKKK